MACIRVLSVSRSIVQGESAMAEGWGKLEMNERSLRIEVP